MVYAITWEYTAKCLYPVSRSRLDHSAADAYLGRAHFISVIKPKVEKDGVITYIPSCHFIEHYKEGSPIVKVVARDYFVKNGLIRESDKAKAENAIKNAARKTGNDVRFQKFISRDVLNIERHDVMSFYDDMTTFIEENHRSNVSAIADFTAPNLNTARFADDRRFFLLTAEYETYINDDEAKEAVKDGTISDRNKRFVRLGLSKSDALRFELARNDFIGTLYDFRDVFSEVGDFEIRLGGVVMSRTDDDECIAGDVRFLVGIPKGADMTLSKEIIKAAVHSCARRIWNEGGPYINDFRLIDIGKVPADPRPFIEMCSGLQKKEENDKTPYIDIRHDEEDPDIAGHVGAAAIFDIADTSDLPEKWQTEELKDYLSEYAGIIDNALQEIVADPRTVGADENAEDIVIGESDCSFVASKEKRLGRKSAIYVVEAFLPPYVNPDKDGEKMMTDLLRKAIEKAAHADRLKLKSIRFISDFADENEVDKVIDDIMT